MTGIKRLVATQIQLESPFDPLLWSRFNLAVNDMIKGDRLLKITMDRTSELSNNYQKEK